MHSMAKSTTLTVRVPAEMKRSLEELAKATGRSQGWLTLDAVQRYLTVESWQVAEIRQALDEADAGDFATDEEVDATFERLGAGASRH